MENINYEKIINDIMRQLNICGSPVKDKIYRNLWTEYVIEDIRSRLEEREIEDLNDSDIEAIADRYVNDGEYDCNLPYWTNIDNLIDEFRIS